MDGPARRRAKADDLRDDMPLADVRSSTDGAIGVTFHRPASFVEDVRLAKKALQGIDPNARRPLHVSLDIDSVDPAFAPGTGTCARGGLTYREIHYVCEELATSRCASSPTNQNSLLRSCAIVLSTRSYRRPHLHTHSPPFPGGSWVWTWSR